MLYTDTRDLGSYQLALLISRYDLKALDNKELLLVGGGRSPIQQAFNDMGINCRVTNVDPYVENPDPTAINIDRDFVNTNFENKFDEIWALYSLPLYSRDAFHALRFYARAVIALKPGGQLRISPLPSDVGGALLARHLPKNALKEEWVQRKLYNLFGFWRPLRTKSAYLDIDARHMQYWAAPKREFRKNKYNIRARALLEDIRGL